MTTTPTLNGSGGTSLRMNDHATKSDGPVVASAGSVAKPDDVDDSDLSVAGEEDPGAALDMIGAGSDGPEAQWCPWPRDASA
jgi:hypothetical protein